MSFGIQNLGVINQKDAPAIWESDFVDFPANFVKGRILIDTFQGGIYLDTTTTRVQIQAGSSGAINYLNGVETFGSSTPTTKNVGLGGTLTRNTNIDLYSKDINFLGSLNSLNILSGGYMEEANYNEIYYTTQADGLVSVIPDITLLFRNPKTGEQYRVLGVIVP